MGSVLAAVLLGLLRFLRSLRGAAARIFPRLFRDRAGKPRENRRKTEEPLPAPTARRGREAGEQGQKRSYLIAVGKLSLLLPLLRCCFSWCWRFGSLCCCCSRCSGLSCRACSSRFERASRSTIARFFKLLNSAQKPKNYHQNNCVRKSM